MNVDQIWTRTVAIWQSADFYRSDKKNHAGKVITAKAIGGTIEANEFFRQQWTLKKLRFLVMTSQYIFASRSAYLIRILVYNQHLGTQRDAHIK